MTALKHSPFVIAEIRHAISLACETLDLETLDLEGHETQSV